MKKNQIHLKLFFILSIPLILSFSKCTSEVKNNHVQIYKVDTLKYQLDTLLNARIDTSEVKVYVLRKKVSTNGLKYNLAINDSVGFINAPISFVVANMQGDSLFYQDFEMDSNYRDYRSLVFYKRNESSLNTSGNLFYTLSCNAGGSGTDLHTFLLHFREGKINSTKLCDWDEISMVVHSKINDNEFLLFQGFSKEGELDSHFGDHHYKISKYKIIQNSIEKIELGQTSNKYPVFGVTPNSDIIKEISTKEPTLFQSTNITEF